MAHGYQDYSYWTGTVEVVFGGTGLNSLTLNGVLLGNGTGNVVVTAAGAAGEVLRVPGGGGAPGFGVVPGGLTVGANLTITGTWPTHNISLDSPLPVTHGGSGDVACTLGQLLVGTGSDTAAWSTPPGCRVYNSALETIGAGLTSLTFDSERYDNGGMHSTVSHTSRLIAPTAGRYVITGNINWWPNSTGIRELFITVNGVDVIASLTLPAIAAVAIRMPIAAIYYLAVGDYVQLQVYQTSGGNLNVAYQPNNSPEFAAQWLGP